MLAKGNAAFTSGDVVATGAAMALISGAESIFSETGRGSAYAAEINPVVSNAEPTSLKNIWNTCDRQESMTKHAMSQDSNVLV